MAKLTITRVITEGELDDSGIRQWSNDYGVFYEVTAFAGRELVTASKKSLADALELQARLVESIDTPLEMVVEHKGTSKNGNAKWKLKEIVGAGNSQGTQVPPMEGAASRDGKPAPEPPVSAPTNTEASIRASVALKAAASSYQSRDVGPASILERADVFDAWLAKKSGAVEQGSDSGTEPPPVVTAPAPDPTSDEGGPGELGEGSLAPSSGTSSGEGPAQPSASGSPGVGGGDAVRLGIPAASANPSPEHIHQPDTSVEAKAGRYPCACGVWVKP